MLSETIWIGTRTRQTIIIAAISSPNDIASFMTRSAPMAERHDTRQSDQRVGDGLQMRTELQIVDARALIGSKAIGIARQPYCSPPRRF